MTPSEEAEVVAYVYEARIRYRALIDAARAICPVCAKCVYGPDFPYKHEEGEKDEWFHPNGDRCKAAAIHEILDREEL